MRHLFCVIVLLLSAVVRADPPADGVVISTRDFPVSNEIDRHVLSRLREASVAPSGMCTDQEFIRRAYLDVCGIIPPAEDTKAFLADNSPGKRAKLIDRLLNHEHYADHWEVMWGDLLREHSVSKRKEGTINGSYRAWIRESLEKNMPYDQFVTKLITASGTAAENAATNFYLRDLQNRVESANTVSQAFMGVQLACAQCHDHPFDKWTQDDFHSLMAFFGRTSVKTTEKGNKNAPSRVSESDKGEYYMPADGDGAKKKRQRSGELVAPVFPWNKSQKAAGIGSRRDALAKFVTGHRQFAAVQVNRLWAQLMGRGIVEPLDDFRPKNPPTHPELLDYLTDEFIRAKFDNKHVLRLILNSAAYQRSSTPVPSNQSDTQLFSHQRVRRLTGEELFDSVLVATGFDDGLKDLPSLASDSSAKGKRAATLKTRRRNSVEWAADLPTPARAGSFMNVFNQPRRDVIAIKRDEEGSIPQALEMLNGKAVNDAISSSPVIDELLSASAPATDVITQLYLSVLSRYPTADEVTIAGKYQSGGREWIEDLYWALLNTREFAFLK